MPSAILDQEELRAWLALWRTPGLGPAALCRLSEALPELKGIFSLPGSALEALGLGPKTRATLAEADWAGADADLRWLESPHHHLLRLPDPDYPAQLRTLDTPPPLLFVVGNPASLSLPQLAIIGSRNPTAGGADNAHQFAEHLGGSGLTITSGLARGIDAAAHRGALAAGGTTIAVMGTGPDRVYPARHRDLAHEIVEHGALVTEFPPGTGPRPEHFPRRNRIISGLSLGTLVVEASLRSGSLITARYALEQGREVYAIPGSIHNPLAKGCHALIRQGAKLVESSRDVLEELPPIALATAAEDPPQETVETDDPLDSEYLQVIDAVGFDPTPVDVVVQRTGLTPGAVSSMLLVLELKGLVTSAAGGRYTRTGNKDVR